MNTTSTKHFIQQRIEHDLAANTYNGKVITRFPPEPNGYLHIGHAKSICLNFNMARQYQGQCNLRFDDTNPIKEEVEFVEAIKQDILWLGFKWDKLFHAANYFEQLFNYALEFIKAGKAYVCSLSPEQIREYRGTLTEPGQNSPYRERSVEENLALFMRMHAGEFKETEHVLRAKIDMTAGNINMRDPVMYRILHAEHPHSHALWHIYPTYDYAHCFSDYIENITHSLCTLEFQDHRPLYDWFLEQVTKPPRPQQIESSRLNLSHTLTSKRNLKKLVEENIVNGWDDPRMPTLVGLRRRGYPQDAIINFCNSLWVSKSDSIIDLNLLEGFVRDSLNTSALRVMCVLKPLKITIENLPEDHLENLTAPNHPQNPNLGNRTIPFTKTIYIEQDDFKEQANKKFHRLKLNAEVRLRYGYIIKCHEVIKNQAGEIIELKCTYDPETLGKNPTDRKVKGVIHWVSASHAKTCQVNLFDRLFSHENPGSAADFEQLLTMLNPNSLEVLNNCYIEPNLHSTAPETRFQFERLGYFVLDRYNSKPENLNFNRIVGLKDSWVF